MNRIATSIVTIAVATTVAQTVGANEATTSTLSTRIDSLEKRVIAIENSIGESREQAMMNATHSNTTYVIQEGDTLGDIARKHSVPRQALLDENKLREGQPIYIGETLLIPGAPASSGTELVKADQTEQQKIAPPPVPTKPEPTKPAPQKVKEDMLYHTVSSGDTLHGISRKYGVTVVSIRTANGLRGDVISPGQRLKISGKASPSNDSQGGDTQKKKSSTYAYDNPLLEANETYGYYTVAKGDNLYALARDFFTTMPELQRLNRLSDSTLIHPGDELIVPTSKYNAYHSNSNMAQR